MQIGVSTTFSEIASDVPLNGGRTDRAVDEKETRGAMQLDAAYALSDRWQVGASLPFVLRARGVAESAMREVGLGDLAMVASWEAITDWDYSLYRPAIYLFGQATIPLDRPALDSPNKYRLDLFGEEQASAGLGVFALKTQLTWDAWLMTSLRQPLSRTQNTSVGDLSIHPGRLLHAGGGFGWSPAAGPLRVGVSVNWDRQTEGQSHGAIENRVAGRTLTTVGFEASYLWEEDLRVAVRYFDQGVLSLTRNSPVAQGISVALQKRWER